MYNNTGKAMLETNEYILWNTCGGNNYYLKDAYRDAIKFNISLS